MTAHVDIRAFNAPPMSTGPGWRTPAALSAQACVAPGVARSVVVRLRIRGLAGDDVALPPTFPRTAWGDWVTEPTEHLEQHR